MAGPASVSAQRRQGHDGREGTEEPSVDPLAAVAEPVEEVLVDFLTERTAALRELAPPLERIGTEVRDFVLAGGKRLRPAFVHWGHLATGADPDPAVLRLGAAVELLHTFALMHDDVMDRSDTRRGRPTVHESLRTAHTEDRLSGDAGWFGIGGAILAGDLAFVWADQLLDTAPLPAEALDRARRVFYDLRVEVMAGQYMDLRLAGSLEATQDDALQVALLKSGRYTVTRPLQLGAAVGEADEVLHAALCTFGDAVGVAFQLRDDILGMFGDPDVTGKGAVEDLREGKRTVLVLHALQRGEPKARRALASMLGNPDLSDRDADAARQIIVETGALAAVERMLEERRVVAERALKPVPEPARTGLTALAELALHRTV